MGKNFLKGFGAFVAIGALCGAGIGAFAASYNVIVAIGNAVARSIGQ